MGKMVGGRLEFAELGGRGALGLLGLGRGGVTTGRAGGALTVGVGAAGGWGDAVAASALDIPLAVVFGVAAGLAAGGVTVGVPIAAPS